MAKVVIVAGDTGTGKSTSIKTLNPEETVIINVLDKALPFKGSSKAYSLENKNIKSTPDFNEIISLLKKVGEKEGVKNVIIDDIGFTMTSEFFKRASEKGYEKFTEIGKHMQQIIVAAQQLPAHINVALMFHDDVVSDDKSAYNIRNIKTIGRILDDKYNPLAIVTVALFTEVEFNKEGKAEYNFITQRTLDRNGVIVPSKSPDGMFESVRIPNDLQLVFNTMNEYYE